MLDDLEKSVLKIYEECIGDNEASISTIDMLRHIELRMESLTQEQELLNPKKVSFETVWCCNILEVFFVVQLIRLRLPESLVRRRGDTGREKPGWRSRGRWRRWGTRQHWTEHWHHLSDQRVGDLCSDPNHWRRRPSLIEIKWCWGKMKIFRIPTVDWEDFCSCKSSCIVLSFV